MEREDLDRLAQATEDDDAQAPEEVVKALLNVAAGKAPAAKQISEWLVSRLMETGSPRVKLKVLRLMMLIMSSKKGAKFKAQLKQDGEEALRMTTVFQTAADPDHGDKPMMWVRKSAVKCLELLELPATAPNQPSAPQNSAPAAAVPIPAPAPAPDPAPASGSPAVRVAAPPPALSAAAATNAARIIPSPAPQASVVNSDLEATIEALIQQRLAVAFSENEGRILAVTRDAQQAKEAVAAAEVTWSARMEALEGRIESLSSETTPKLASFAEVEKRFRATLEEAAKAMAEGGDTALTTMAALRLEEMGQRVDNAQSIATAAKLSSATSLSAAQEKLDTLASLLLQLRDRANLSERQAAKLCTDVTELCGRVDSISGDVDMKINKQQASLSQAQIQAEELQVQLEMMDAKFTDANGAQAQWMQQELGHANADVTAVVTSIHALETKLGQVSASTLDAQTQAVGEVQGAVARLEGKLGAAETRIVMLEAGGDIGACTSRCCS